MKTFVFYVKKHKKGLWSILEILHLITKRFKGKFLFKYTKQDNNNSLQDIIIRVPKDPKLIKGFVSVM